MLSRLAAACTAGALALASQSPLQELDGPLAADDPIPYSTRAHWMRQANEALTLLSSPCPFQAFGTVIVNHTARTSGGLGELVCTGVNRYHETGNPTLHGEVSAINNCTTILTDPKGVYGLSPSEAASAFADLSLYTNGEPCPMCAAAIRWSGFKECVFGSSVGTLIKAGWSQFRLPSSEVFQRSWALSHETKLVAEVLTNETDPLYMWQYNKTAPCPKGCRRSPDGELCTHY